MVLGGQWLAILLLPLLVPRGRGAAPGTPLPLSPSAVNCPARDPG